MRKTLALLLITAALTACFGGKDKEPILEGNRINITARATGLTANPAALQAEFALPAQVQNPYWGQTMAVSSHAPGSLALPGKVVRAYTAKMGSGMGRGAKLLNPPVVHSGRLFGIDTNSAVTALDAKTGKQLWSVKLKLKEPELAKLSGGLAVTGDLLYVTTGGGQVFCLQASTGKEVWKIDLAIPLRAAPSIMGEQLFVTSHDSRIFGLNALTGALQWTHSGLEESLSSLRAASPAVANGVVAVPYSSGELYMLRATDGRYIWHDVLSTPFSGSDPATTLNAISSPPVMADGIVYAVGLGGGLSAYGITNGQRFWKANVITSQPIWVAGTAIFVLTDDGELAAVNRRDGLIRWVVELGEGLPEAKDRRFWSGPVLAGGRLIVVSSDGYAVSIAPTDGKRLAATDLEEPVSLPPIVADGALYFITDNARVIAFQAPSTSE
ncbi:MAG: hypothetical protein COY40_03330 [Alphaproteobacteria bacterium CG_4_10_14_0_8_um_filter_53_9]|nr:MAG: hypothetical protein COY40_03330 [Alphaproteobacteria bacterium CG_4_10_14_0_8_um_filter_53_9]